MLEADPESSFTHMLHAAPDAYHIMGSGKIEYNTARDKKMSNIGFSFSSNVSALSALTDY
jgi:hypothetical protein